MQHAAIYVKDDTDKKELISNIFNGKFFDGIFNTKNVYGEEFSVPALQYFIDEELKHDHLLIDTGLNNFLANASSGEQRKALLKYLLSKQPAYIILDDVYESLDWQVRRQMQDVLEDAASHIYFIQLLNRKEDLLPFIETIYYTAGNKITDQKSRAEFLQQTVSANHSIEISIPAPPQLPPVYNNPLIRLVNVNVRYEERPIIKDINWEINNGEFWQLIGPNGAGKSTILSMITGDNAKAYGQDLWLFGKRKGTGETVWQIKEKIGYFNPKMIRDFDRPDSAEQMIISGFVDSVGLYIKPTDSQKRMALQWLKVIGLEKEKNKDFRLLPAGQQRMILVARAMVKHPPLLILDEPASGLDDEAALLLTKLINRVAAETKTAILYVSHRREPGLNPDKIYQLTPSPSGSTGSIG